jgi:hypothetical protein
VSAEELAELCCSAAAAQRLGMLAQGGAALARLVDGLAPLLARDPAAAGRIGAPVAALLAAQQRGDPLGLADELEHVLAPALRGTGTKV